MSCTNVYAQKELCTAQCTVPSSNGFERVKFCFLSGSSIGIRIAKLIVQRCISQIKTRLVRFISMNCGSRHLTAEAFKYLRVWRFFR